MSWNNSAIFSSPNVRFILGCGTGHRGHLPAILLIMTVNKKVPVTVLNGFLGSGKTTLLRSLLIQAAKSEPPLRLAAIVNDMSSLDVDGLIVEGAEVVSESEGNFISISGGSIHGPEMLPALITACDTLIERAQPEHILIETSGSTRPWPLIKALEAHPGLQLRGFLSLVDAGSLRSDFSGGKAIFPAVSRQLETGEQGIEMLIAQQLMFASEIYLTKVDKLRPGQAREIAEAISPINPFVGITALHFANIHLGQVLDYPAYDFHRVELLGSELEERDRRFPEQANIVSAVINDPRPFHPQRLWEAFNTALPQALYRSKGLTWLPGRDDRILLWNQAGGAINLEFFNYWKAGVLTHEPSRLSERERSELSKIVAEIDPVFGDRRTSITMLGEKEETTQFHQLLLTCLCTAKEVEAWLNGEDFVDPWPTDAIRLSEVPN